MLDSVFGQVVIYKLHIHEFFCRLGVCECIDPSKESESKNSPVFKLRIVVRVEQKLHVPLPIVFFLFSLGLFGILIFNLLLGLLFLLLVFLLLGVVIFFGCLLGVFFLLALVDVPQELLKAY